VAKAFIGACCWATLMPQEEPESPGEVRSLRKSSPPSVDERTRDALRGERRE
jgi:hypothetical protein